MSAKTFVQLSEHAERDRVAAAEADGNGRTGVFVKLTVKQVSSFIALAMLVAGGAVKFFTHEPEAVTAPARAVVEQRPDDQGRLEEFRREISKDIDGLRDVVLDTRARLGRIERRQDKVDDAVDALSRIERKVDAMRAGRPANAGEGGGSK